MSMRQSSAFSSDLHSDLPQSDRCNDKEVEDSIVQPDPLLESGTFIDANDRTLPEYVARRSESQHPDSDDSHCVGNATKVSHSLNSPEIVTPPPPQTVDIPTSPINSRKTSRKRIPKASSITEVSDSLGWLPSGWVVEDKVRSSGATAGLKDRYYFEPVAGHRFRSKLEVLRFLETGIKGKRYLKGEAEVPVKTTPGKRKRKDSCGSKETKSGALNFNFNDVPECVKWELTDASAGIWNPFIGGEKIPEYNRRSWDAAFESQSKS